MLDNKPGLRKLGSPRREKFPPLQVQGGKVFPPLAIEKQNVGDVLSCRFWIRWEAPALNFPITPNLEPENTTRPRYGRI